MPSNMNRINMPRNSYAPLGSLITEARKLQMAELSSPRFPPSGIRRVRNMRMADSFKNQDLRAKLKFGRRARTMRAAEFQFKNREAELKCSIKVPE
jgi:hypothetical protein